MGVKRQMLSICFNQTENFETKKYGQGLTAKCLAT